MINGFCFTVSKYHLTHRLPSSMVTLLPLIPGPGERGEEGGVMRPSLFPLNLWLILPKKLFFSRHGYGTIECKRNFLLIEREREREDKQLYSPSIFPIFSQVWLLVLIKFHLPSLPPPLPLPVISEVIITTRILYTVNNSCLCWIRFPPSLDSSIDTSNIDEKFPHQSADTRGHKKGSSSPNTITLLSHN